MCGICGIATTHGAADVDALRAMSDLLVHRGPDSAGEHVDGGVALAARRLSIIDLEHGDQPIPNEDGSVVLVCNGEIFNYKELRGSDSKSESSAQIRERVVRTREVQLNRFAAAGERIYSNAQMSTRQIRTYCDLGTDSERMLERAMQQQGLSARAHDRILKVARTIADMDGAAQIEGKHIAEAIQYRTLDRSYWA